MQRSLMIGITEKDMQAVINTYDLKPYYYPTLFPLKENYTLTWKALEAQVGLKIAGDLVARGASINKKTREAIARIQGDIPKVAIKRTKDENELNEYDIMVAMTSANPDLRALVEAWAEDTQYCWDGVAARLEWIALQSISLGKVTLTNDNNNSVITEYDVDYQIDATQKVGFQTGSAAWNTTGAKPFSKDFKAIVAKAKKKGISLKYAFMNLDTFALMVQTEEVTKLCASFAANALNTASSPSLPKRREVRWKLRSTRNSVVRLTNWQSRMLRSKRNLAKSEKCLKLSRRKLLNLRRSTALKRERPCSAVRLQYRRRTGRTSPTLQKKKLHRRNRLRSSVRNVMKLLGSVMN